MKESASHQQRRPTALTSQNNVWQLLQPEADSLYYNFCLYEILSF
jgi:hypothetical protein